ncbi:type II toxin-antitoxin system VapC family toxin [Candidatus Neomicrothrix sp.]|uniref:type II toxin-antitoxin system VapC family toxin n=1 Tax=Candidatus Neomicrothrix sp. TaxID=2719034 RepID=UPI001E193F0C|nr:type II toxin-antitoxin system VapC family toxin [Candidatus Microthrix sp.]MBK6437077.1 type II toxin-antitoxin system VapC family toxin [Candidatus Microthrix sp.]HMS46181.1 type II toxin-antitoxin system VapC family toxin [Candidatus Microthrix sp.]
MLVVDASVIAPLVADDGQGSEGKRYRRRLRGELLVAPDLMRVQVLSVLRVHAATATLTPDRAEQAAADLFALPVEVFTIEALLPRIWELRHNVTPYDACYVALAESLDCTLLSADRRLGRAPGIRCAIEFP